ncbi:sensor histidine kinase [Nakamurella aerolata]|uniref:histidine kinase n=1 Tax=Nakamurella aerolata TaxID=1656892 RepID=A0A849A9W8_9ACTN|nr:HAMP domain-containing sensor histidine kinase [Nakamurella aerolata]NNG35280.1 HAMP domain-containing histidine kinase [Nakamurella aerolata]
MSAPRPDQDPRVQRREPLAGPGSAAPITGGLRTPLPTALNRKDAAPSYPAFRPRRWTLRARLTALMLVIAAAAMGTVDILLPINLRSSLSDSMDTNLRTVIASIQQPFNVRSLAYEAPSSDVGLTLVTTDGVAKVVRASTAAGDANPQVGSSPPTTGIATVGDVHTRAKYRILAVAIRDVETNARAGYVVAWAPLAPMSEAVGELVVTALLITAAVLILLGAVASVVIRRELKPLEAMATAADDIAAGDLGRRVYPGSAGTEVARLGYAFNGMLDGISQLLDERARNEQRMRQFLADASHELRTPVAAVRGYTDLYKAGMLPEDEAVGRAMQRMGFEADRMGALVGDLLTLIQADNEGAEKYEPVDLAEVLTGVVDDAAVIDPTRTWRMLDAGGRVNPQVGTPPDPESEDYVRSGAGDRQTDPHGFAPVGSPRPLVIGDRHRLHQVFANLLANIRTHTDPGTVATVQVGVTGGEVTVVVSDNGPGVSDADLPKLFDRFYRVDASRSRIKGGTGLGLSIVSAIVRNHRGRVTASHTPGGGLTTTVTLPLWLEPLKTPGAPSKTADHPDGADAADTPRTSERSGPISLGSGGLAQRLTGGQRRNRSQQRP